MRSLAVLALALAASGCNEYTAVRIWLQRGASAPQPQQVQLDVYDDFGRIGEISRSDAKLPADAEVLVSSLSTTVRASLAGGSRVVSGGTSFFETTSETIGIQRIVPGEEVTMTLTLDTKIPPDSDGDGVPDAIDNCPDTYNPEQACAAGDGIGDDCRGEHNDMAVADLARPVAPASCGNGVREAGEQCDDGANNDDSVTTTISRCTTQCRLKANCGDATDANGVLDPATGVGYAVFSTPKNWEDAQRDCQRQGGNLASIGSGVENQRVSSLLGSTTAWIGLSIAPAGGNSWVDGRAVSFVGTPGGSAPDGGPSGECYVDTSGSWALRPCGWPASGQLGPSPSQLHGYVCRFTCGNGVIESPVEGCEPPGTASCTQTCQRMAACTETEGLNSPVSGHCYFTMTTAVPYASATCPAGTHLATLSDEAETETALQAVSLVGPSWIGLRSPVTATQWDSGAIFNPRQYHGFVSGQPAATPADSTTVDPMLGGWSNQAAATASPYLCERP